MELTRDISPMPETLLMKIGRMLHVLNRHGVHPNAIMVTPTDYEGMLGELGWSIDDKCEPPQLVRIQNLPIIQGQQTAFIMPIQEIPKQGLFNL